MYIYSESHLKSHTVKQLEDNLEINILIYLYYVFNEFFLKGLFITNKLNKYEKLMQIKRPSLKILWKVSIVVQKLGIYDLCTVLFEIRR